MTIQIVLVIIFTVLIHLISTLSYSVRIVGIRTRNDDVIDGKYSEIQFRKTIGLMVASRAVGTLMAQLLLVPFARFISWIATSI